MKTKASLTFAMTDAWLAATAVVARAYPGVTQPMLTAPSAGRAGPRPPRACWEAKKVAVHLTVSISGCDYAALGRHVGLHKDTVASHCAQVRDEITVNDRIGAQVAALELLAMQRCAAMTHTQIDAVRAHLAMLEDIVRDKATEQATLSDLAAGLASSDRHPTFHPTKAEQSQKRDVTVKPAGEAA